MDTNPATSPQNALSVRTFVWDDGPGARSLSLVLDPYDGGDDVSCPGSDGRHTLSRRARANWELARFFSDARVRVRVSIHLDAFWRTDLFLARLGEQLVLHAPALGIGLGIGLLVAIGLYQMTPLERRCLAQCHPSLCCDLMQPSASTTFSRLREGLTHGGVCLGCCGGLMLVMVVVGLMNLPWMVLLTVVIFVEKTWRQGARLSFFVGFSLLVFAVLALAVPALLAGLYQPG